MSAATATAGNARSITSIKADMANVLSNRPESLLADAKAAIRWLPRKARRAAIAAFRLLRAPQAWAFARSNIGAFMGIVGRGAFATEALTSKWGQASLRKGANATARLVRFAITLAWKIMASPLRMLTPAKGTITKIESAASTIAAKLTLDSGETFGWLQITRDIVGYQVSSERAYMKLARVTALAAMSIRVTGQFIPDGWLRFLVYGLDGLVIARAYLEVLDRTWLGRRLARQAKLIETDVRRQAETVGAEATRMTRTAAAEVASRLRAEADEIEAETKAAGNTLRADLVIEGTEKAQELRAEADAMEATAARMEKTAVPVRPKPGPTVPPKEAQAPGSGPAQPSHQQHGRKETAPRR